MTAKTRQSFPTLRLLAQLLERPGVCARVSFDHGLLFAFLQRPVLESDVPECLQLHRGCHHWGSTMSHSTSKAYPICHHQPYSMGIQGAEVCRWFCAQIARAATVQRCIWVLSLVHASMLLCVVFLCKRRLCVFLGLHTRTHTDSHTHTSMYARAHTHTPTVRDTSALRQQDVFFVFRFVGITLEIKPECNVEYRV